MEKTPQINHIAELAKIKFNEDESEKMKKELAKIIDYMNKIKELAPEKMSEVYTKTAYLRDDIQLPSIPTQIIYSFAHHFYKNYFIVPKII